MGERNIIPHRLPSKPVTHPSSRSRGEDGGGCPDGVFGLFPGRFPAGESGRRSPNRPPRWEIPSGDQSFEVELGKSLEFEVSVTDPDGDTVTCSTNLLPSGAAFDRGKSRFRWEPGKEQVGRYLWLELMARDNKGAVTRYCFNVSVKPPSLPVATSAGAEQTTTEPAGGGSSPKTGPQRAPRESPGFNLTPDGPPPPSSSGGDNRSTGGYEPERQRRPLPPSRPVRTTGTAAVPASSQPATESGGDTETAAETASSGSDSGSYTSYGPSLLTNTTSQSTSQSTANPVSVVPAPTTAAAAAETSPSPAVPSPTPAISAETPTPASVLPTPAAVSTPSPLPSATPVPMLSPSPSPVTGLALGFSSYLGGSGTDEANCIDIDSSGNVYIAGYTLADDFPTANPLQPGAAGNEEVFIGKFSSTGSALLYSTYLGGSADERAYGLAVGDGGTAYVSGETTSADFPTRNPYQAGMAGGQDAFACKLSSTGSALLYSTYLGGSGGINYSTGLAVEGDSAYVYGYTNTADFPTVNPAQGSLAANSDVFISKLASDGASLDYSTYLGGNNMEYAQDIAVENGYAFVSGGTYSTDFPTVNPYQDIGPANRDIFAAKLSTSGSVILYSTYLGGLGDDYGYGIAVENGYAYILGQTDAADFPTRNAYQASLAGASDAFLCRFATSGSALVYSTYLGGSGSESGDFAGFDIAVENGAAYLCGSTNSADFPVNGPWPGAGSGSNDIFLCKVASDGTHLVYSTLLGGSSSDSGFGIAVAGDGVYICGNTGSSDFMTANAYQASLAGGLDAFVTKLDWITTPSPAPSPTPTPSGGGGGGGAPRGFFMTEATPAPPGVGTAPEEEGKEDAPDEEEPAARPVVGDYTGNGTAELAVFRPSHSLWAVRGLTRLFFGRSGDLPVNRDYDGDGIMEMAVYCPKNGFWAIRGFSRFYYGKDGDIPVPGDYDGDGLLDPAVFSADRGSWRVRFITRFYFGAAGDDPVPADYDGDGTTDPAVFRPDTGLWAVRGFSRRYYGADGDVPVPGLYAGKPGDPSLLAVYRPSGGLWLIGGQTGFRFGGGDGDVPVPLDYDGDLIEDIAVFDSSTGRWAVRGLSRAYFGGE